MPSSMSSIQSAGSEEVRNDLTALKVEQMENAFEQFTRISKSFVHSYQNLEDRVESLADKLALEVANKNTQLLEKERLASRLQSLLSILPAGVVVIDGSGRVNECNKVAIDLLGIPLLGEKWVEVIQRSFRPRHDDGYEVSLVDGRRIRIETRSLDYEPGQLIVLTDLTKTRQLQDQVNQDRRLTSMGRMMAALAHQIRTPLSTATLYADSLKSHIKSEQMSQDQAQNFSEKLADCLGHLERHINDMLQFAKSGGLKLEQHPVNIVVGTLISDIENHYQDVSVQTTPCTETSNQLISINSDAISSTLRNLIDNAKQATAKQDNAVVSCYLAIEGNKLKIAVEDNGPGIEEAKQTKVFDPFYTTKAGGTGLGLAVVHGVVRAHSGHLYIDSKRSKGCRMVLQLPFDLDAKEHRTDEHYEDGKRE